jgi:hypothetical protein
MPAPQPEASDEIVEGVQVVDVEPALLLVSSLVGHRAHSAFRFASLPLLAPTIAVIPRDADDRRGVRSP